MRGLLTRVSGILAALTLVMAGAGAASAQAVKTLHTNASLIAERTAVAPGDTFLGALKLDLEDPWHVYWLNPGDSGLPPTVTWTLPEGVTAGDFQWPAPHAIPLATLMNYGYEHRLVLPVEFKVPATAKPGETIKLDGKFDWLICSDVCVPDGATLSLTLPVEAARKIDTAASADIAPSLLSAPGQLTGGATVERTADGFKVAAVDGDLAEAAKTASNIHFFPEGHEIIHAASQQVRRGDAGVSVTMKASDYAKPSDQPLPGIIVVKAADGSLRSWQVPAQPGAVPAGVADASVGGGGSDGAPVGFVEIALMMGGAFLGGLILNLMPCVLPVLAVKAAGLVHTAHDPKQSRAHGLAYLGGVMTCFAVIAAVIVGLQMAGQQVGVGFQLQYAPIVAFFALVMFALGLNLLGVFEMGTSLMGVGQNLAGKGGTSGAYYTGLLAAFVGAPCVGPFMAVALGWALTQPAPIIIAMFLIIGLGMAAPFVLLSFTPVMARLIPKPGAWMATFRQVLAFPMFAAMLWLLWVVAGQTGTNGALVVLGGAIFLGFGIWLATKIGAKLPGRILAGLLILAGFVVPAVATAGIKAPVGGETLAAEAGAEDWSVDRVNALRAEGRVVFVDFTARWCVTCQVNKSVAIDTAKVRDAFAKNNVAFLVADWTNQDSVIAAALAEHGRAGVPLYLVYPASGGEPEVLPQVLTPGLVVKAIETAAGA